MVLLNLTKEEAQALFDIVYREVNSIDSGDERFDDLMTILSNKIRKIL